MRLTMLGWGSIREFVSHQDDGGPLRGQGRFSVLQPQMDAHRKPRAESEMDIPKFLSQAGEAESYPGLTALDCRSRSLTCNHCSTSPVTWERDSRVWGKFPWGSGRSNLTFLAPDSFCPSIWSTSRGGLDHRHDPGANGFGQSIPGVDDCCQVRVSLTSVGGQLVASGLGRCKPLPIPFFLVLLFWLKENQPLSFWGYFG